MPGWLRAQFNGWFGSNLTHVANGNRKSIWVCLHEEEVSIKDIQVAIERSKEETRGSLKVTLERTIGTSLTTVPVGESHKFERSHAWDRLTIITEDGVLLTGNYRIPANRSYIVTAEGSLRQQEYGCSNLFKDDYGVDHCPK